MTVGFLSFCSIYLLLLFSFIPVTPSFPPFKPLTCFGHQHQATLCLLWITSPSWATLMHMLWYICCCISVSNQLMDINEKDKYHYCFQETWKVNWFSQRWHYNRRKQAGNFFYRLLLEAAASVATEAIVPFDQLFFLVCYLVPLVCWRVLGLRPPVSSQCKEMWVLVVFRH